MKRASISVAMSLALAATLGLAGPPAEAGAIRVGGSVAVAGPGVPITTAIKDPIVPKGFFTVPLPPRRGRFPRGFQPVGVISTPVIIDNSAPDMYGAPGYDYDQAYYDQGYYVPDGPPAAYYPPAAYSAPAASYPPAAYAPAPYPGPAYAPPAPPEGPPVAAMPAPPPMGQGPSPAAYMPASGQPMDRAVSLTPAPSNPNVVQYPAGRYELRGDGMSSPFAWVWIPNPPPPPPPPGPPPAGSVYSGDPSMARRSRLYQWTDDQGVMHLTDRLESVPPQYRALAKQTPPS